MKKIIKLLFGTLLIAVTFLSCKKDENQIFFEGGTAPALTASSATIPLSFPNSNNLAVILSWTNPNYQFTTGISSHDVNYLLEIDTTGANFTNPNRQSIAISKELTRSFTQGELNGYLLNQLQLVPGVPHNIQLRITSSLINGSVPLKSNVLSFTVTPFSIPPVVPPPASGKLFITGSATPGNWMGGGDPELSSQRFTQVSPTLYVLNSIALNGGGSYLLVPRYGNWSAVPPDPEKYGGLGGNNTNNVNGDDFKAFGGDLLAPAVSGNYKIEVDFQRGKFTVTKL